MDFLIAQALSVTIADKQVCRDLDLHVRRGHRWAVLGANGSGKTTLLHTLAGFRPAQGGEIMIEGRHLNTWQPRQRARLLGMLLQHYDDPFPSTVLETALIGRHPHLQRWEWEDSDDVAQARRALESMDLAGFENRTIATLSGGERRRLAIATLLRALELFTRLASQQARALIMVLHDITSAVRYCDHALLLFGEGETLAGAVTDVVTEENLARLYGHPIRRITGPDGDVWTPVFSVT